MPRAAGDGIYDVLGYGYDITSDYLGEASVRQPVLDVEAFIRDNKGRFDNPFIGTIEQKVTAGEDAWSFLQQTISNTNFSGSVAAMGKSDTSKAIFLRVLLQDLSLILNIHILPNILLRERKL